MKLATLAATIDRSLALFNVTRQQKVERPDFCRCPLFACNDIFDTKSTVCHCSWHPRFQMITSAFSLRGADSVA